MNGRRTLIELFERLHYEITKQPAHVPERYQPLFDKVGARIVESGLNPVAYFTCLIKWTLDTNKSPRAYGFYASETAVKVACSVAKREVNKQPQGGSPDLKRHELLERILAAKAQVEEWIRLYRGTNGYFVVMPMVDELYLALDYVYVANPDDPSLPISGEKRESVKRWRHYLKNNPKEQLPLVQALRS